MLRRLKQESGLDDPRQMAISSQLQTLLFRPRLHLRQAPSQLRAPILRTQATALVSHQPVEQPHGDVVEQLREQLNGEGGVDPAAPQQVHSLVEDVQDVSECGPRLVAAARLHVLDVIGRVEEGGEHKVQLLLHDVDEVFEGELHAVGEQLLGGGGGGGLGEVHVLFEEVEEFGGVG